MKSLVPIVLTLGLLSSAAVAETSDERQACMNDAFRVCANFIPDRDRVTACMVQNKSRLGATCRAVMARYSQPEPAKAIYSARRTIRGKNARADAN
jgi:hypothetical protein